MRGLLLLLPLLCSCPSLRENPEAVAKELDLIQQDLTDLQSLVEGDEELSTALYKLSDVLAVAQRLIEDGDEVGALPAIHIALDAVEAILVQSEGLSEEDRVRVQAAAFLARAVLRRIEAQ